MVVCIDWKCQFCTTLEILLLKHCHVLIPTQKALYHKDNSNTCHPWRNIGAFKHPSIFFRLSRAFKHSIAFFEYLNWAVVCTLQRTMRMTACGCTLPYFWYIASLQVGNTFKLKWQDKHSVHKKTKHPPMVVQSFFSHGS